MRPSITFTTGGPDIGGSGIAGLVDTGVLFWGQRGSVAGVGQ